VLHYHNVTPAYFFEPWDAGLARFCQAGRDQLAAMADRTDLALGVSEYNRAELEALGFPDTGVLPIAVDTERLRNAPRVPTIDSILGSDFVNILYVGRIAPNKKIEDIIRMAEHYKRYVDFRYRFIFVGKYDAVPQYYNAIRGLIAEYRMMNERFWFTGPVPDAELAAYYRNAHAYVSLSEHEGFCVPLVEAMSMDVPVLAYGAGAVPETLGGAGVCFTPKDLEQAAELLGALIYDEPFRSQVITGQRARLKDFSRERLETQVRSVLAAVA
jgi:glycosyltransferase involved in cell wall biosynthesis